MLLGSVWDNLTFGCSNAKEKDPSRIRAILEELNVWTELKPWLSDHITEGPPSEPDGDSGGGGALLLPKGEEAVCCCCGGCSSCPGCLGADAGQVEEEEWSGW